MMTMQILAQRNEMKVTMIMIAETDVLNPMTMYSNDTMKWQ